MLNAEFYGHEDMVESIKVFVPEYFEEGSLIFEDDNSVEFSWFNLARHSFTLTAIQFDDVVEILLEEYETSQFIYTSVHEFLEDYFFDVVEEIVVGGLLTGFIDKYGSEV